MIIKLFLSLFVLMSLTTPTVGLEPPKNGGVYVIAHRGAHDGIPENTLAAYRKAIELGVDFVEIDVRTTKDGQLVSIHNRTIDAYTDGDKQGKVADLTLAELKALDIGSRVDARWKGERVPTLDEILKLCQGKIGIYLDPKNASVEAVVERIRAYGMQQQVVWCISPAQVAELRQSCPQCVPMPDPESEEGLVEMIVKTQAEVVAPVWSDFSETFSDKSHSAGALVFVDERESDPANWSLALEWGADGIQTDDPAGLIDFLKRREAYRKKR